MWGINEQLLRALEIFTFLENIFPMYLKNMVEYLVLKKTKLKKKGLFQRYLLKGLKQQS